MYHIMENVMDALLDPKVNKKNVEARFFSTKTDRFFWALFIYAILEKNERNTYNLIVNENWILSICVHFGSMYIPTNTNFQNGLLYCMYVWWYKSQLIIPILISTFYQEKVGILQKRIPLLLNIKW